MASPQQPFSGRLRVRQQQQQQHQQEQQLNTNKKSPLILGPVERQHQQQQQPRTNNKKSTLILTPGEKDQKQAATPVLQYHPTSKTTSKTGSNTNFRNTCNTPTTSRTSGASLQLLHSCENCGFSTRHRVIYDRHTRRCDRKSANSATGGRQQGSKHQQRPPQVVARNYKCKKCVFATNRSKEFLRHLRYKHKEDVQIFPCDLCEYASRYKCKVLRHRKFVHRTAKPIHPDAFSNESEDSLDSMMMEPDLVGNGASVMVPPLTPEGVIMEKDDHDVHDIDGIHEMEQGSSGDDDIQEVINNNGDDAGGPEDGSAAILENDPIRSSVQSINSPIKSTDNAFHYIQKLANSPESQQPAYQCALCTYSNVLKWKVANHVRSFHMKKKVFKCPVCPYVTSRKIEFCIHKTKHSDTTANTNNNNNNSSSNNNNNNNVFKKIDINYECEECEFCTDSQEAFHQHQQNHVAKLPFKCALCTYSSTTEEIVQQHIKDCHPSTELALNNDVPEEVPIQMLPPVAAGGTMELPISLPSDRNHIEDHQTNPLGLQTQQYIACRVCGLKVKNESKLRIHMVSHSTESSHACPLCTLKYKRSSDLNRHMKRKHGKRLRDYYAATGGAPPPPVPPTLTLADQQLMQPGLPQQTPDEQPLNLSVTKEEMEAMAAGYGPPSAIMMQPSESPLLFTANGEEQPLDLSMPKSAPGVMPVENLKCSHCSYHAKWPSDLRRHLLVHSVEKRFKCPCCHRKYKYQFDLNMHLRRMHRIPAGRTKVFPTGSGMSSISNGPPVVNVTDMDSESVTLPEVQQEESYNHEFGLDNNDEPMETVVDDETPTPGEQQFAQLNPSNLRYKLTRQQVSPQGKYKCNYCPYLGKYQSEVDRHMRLHTGEKPYSCVYCDYRSHWRGDMKRHLQKHHGTEDAVIGDITNLMEQTYRPMDNAGNSSQDRVTNNTEGSDDIMVVEPDDDFNDADRPLQIDVSGSGSPQRKNPPEDPGSDQDGMEFRTLTPTSSSSGSAAVSPNKMSASAEKGRNLCPYCPFTCEAPSKLKCHMEIHENLKRFKCAHCGKRSNWTWDVRKHIKKEHPRKELIVIEMKEEEARETLGDYLQSHYKVLPKPKDLLMTHHHHDRNELPTLVPLNRITDQLPPVDTMGVLAPLHPSNLISDDLSSFHDDNDSENPVNDYTTEPPPSFLSPRNQAGSARDPSTIRHPSVATKRCRPFKCSKCGRRSNWKWDMNKHIRNVHPNARLIILTPEEARATMPKGGFKNTNNQNIGVRSGSTAIHNNGGSGRKENLMKLPTSPQVAAPVVQIKPEIQHHPSPPKQKHNHQFDSNRTKKFKCSACPYRSDYRSDIGRHLKRLHPPGAATIEMLTDEEARATLQEYKDRWVRGKFVFSPAKEKLYNEVDQHGGGGGGGGGGAARRTLSPAYDLVQQHGASQSMTQGKPTTGSQPPSVVVASATMQGNNGVNMENHQVVPYNNNNNNLYAEKARKWKCPKCNYQNANKKMVMRHMRQHPKVKVFQCRLCGEASDYRNSMYRHVRNRHGSTDYNGVVHESIAYVTTEVKSELDPSSLGEDDDDRPLTYRCKICAQTSSWKSGIVRHVTEMHEKEPVHMHVEVIRVANILPALPQQVSDSGEVYFMSPDDAKQLRCDVCPYRTNKSGLLKIHKTYHRPQPGNKFKCKYCPYYVSAMRLLHQHVRLHLAEIPVETNNNNHDNNHGDNGEGEEEEAEENEMEIDLSTGNTAGTIGGMSGAMTLPGEGPPSPTSKMGMSLITSPTPQTSPGRRYYCDQCPAVSRNKNDFLYHKQFHRPKPSAPFKCKLCNYWVSQRRLLRQHERVHLSEYIEHYHNNSLNSPKPEVLKTYADKGGSIPQMVLASPAKSDISDYDDAVQVANLKQQIIASKITTVPITPQKFQQGAPSAAMLKTTTGSLNVPGYMVDSASGQYLHSGTLQQLNKCSKCPFACLRSALLNRHEAMHGQKPSSSDGVEWIQCPYCSFYVPNRKLLHKHIIVHSTSYQPGVDNINDVELSEDDVEKDDEEGVKEEGTDKEMTHSSSTPSAVLTNAAPPRPQSSHSSPHAHNHAADGDDLVRGVKRNADGGAVLDMRSLPKYSEYYVKYDAAARGQHQMQLERGSFKKWCCEKCPYATMKRAQFERHITLHASAQKYVCEYCDYSVPAYHLLLQHKKLHLHPNPNLLTTQSLTNLTRLPEIPADAAAAAGFPTNMAADPASQTGHQDATTSLFENSAEFSEPKKLYRCDRCPYTNVRRDHLLSHLRFHMVASDFKCPYCDYSVSKQHLLVQHIKVHFNAPGSEGSYITPNAALNLTPSGSAGKRPSSAPATSVDETKMETETGPAPTTSKEEGDESNLQPEYIDLAELSKAGLLKPVRCNDPVDLKKVDLDKGQVKDTEVKEDSEDKESKAVENSGKEEKEAEEKEGSKKESILYKKEADKKSDALVCQYCDRVFKVTADLKKHETQHLVGNMF